ncbi:MAG TPA: hypothetical protein VN231_03925 [Allosphingosinicella sp.]|nr:hypothetical protein [Allosphingosinicella sp.]
MLPFVALASRRLSGARFCQDEARPAEPDRFNRPFLEQTLAEARVRAASDAGYAQALQVGGGGWRCIDEDGFEVFTSNLCLRLIRRGILIAVFAFL